MFEYITSKFKSPAKEEQRAISVASLPSIFTAQPTGNAYMISTSYACIRLLSSSIASAPIKHIDMSDFNEKEIDSPISRLFKQPSAYVTYFQWMQAMTTSLVANGNGYSMIVRKNGEPVELVYLEESAVSIYKTLDPNIPYYYQITNDGRSFKLFPEDVIHFKNITIDGLIGLSPIAYHRITFDAAASINDYNKTFMDNATSISGIISTDKNLNAETVEEIRQNFGKKFGGVGNAGRTPVLSNGMKYTQINVTSPLDADYINNRKMSKSDIAEIYGVPLGLVTNTESKYSNAEQESLNFQQITLAPYFDMIDQELSIKLLPFYKTRNTLLKFKPDRFRMTTSKERSEALSLLKNTGIITPNEARKHYGLPDMVGGDELVSTENAKGDAVQAPKTPEDTNTVPGTVADLNAKRSFETPEEIEKEIQRLKSHLGRITKENNK